MILEIYQKYIKKFGSVNKAIEEGYFVEWNTERIIGAFNNGNGTKKDLKRYMNDNKKLCVFVNR